MKKCFLLYMPYNKTILWPKLIHFPKYSMFLGLQVLPSMFISLLCTFYNTYAAD